MTFESVAAILGPIAGARAWASSAPLSYLIADSGARYCVSRDDRGRIVKIDAWEA